MKWIPNLITISNLFLGCLALVLVFAGTLHAAAILVFVCAALDFLDGAAARLLRAGSATGQQLDSLADLLSFGVVPASMLYVLMTETLQRLKPTESLFVLPLLAFFVVIGSAWRLARFNVGEKESQSFSGLPTPANAMLIASIPLALHYSLPVHPIHQLLAWLTADIGPLVLLSLGLSVLLVAPLKMFSLKMHSLGWQGNQVRMVFLAGCALLLLVFGLGAAPLLLIFYILLSLLNPWRRQEGKL